MARMDRSMKSLRMIEVWQGLRCSQVKVGQNEVK